MSDVKPEFPVRTGRGDVPDAGDLLHHDRGGGGAALGLPNELSQLQPGPGAGQTTPPPLRPRRTDNNKSYNRELERVLLSFPRRQEKGRQYSGSSKSQDLSSLERLNF